MDMCSWLIIRRSDPVLDDTSRGHDTRLDADA
jgi:hypothetical protein